MSKTQPIGFVSEIKKMLGSGEFNPLDRDTLTKLANDPDTEKVWSNIKKACGYRANLVIHLAIWEILGARKLALSANEQPNYVKHAEMAEHLAAFVRDSDAFLIPLPHIGTEKLAKALDEVASTLRVREEACLVHVSRNDRNGSRQYTHFMRLLGLTIHGWCGHWCDAEVADLTNILFPDADATTDAVRAARRPKTSRGRSKNNKLAA